MTAQHSKAAQIVLDLIATRDHVSFIEIERALAPLIPTKGDLAWELTTCPNLILWDGMSEAWIEVMEEVRETGLTTMESASMLVYMIDGGLLRLPIAKSPPQGGYKTPHWAPACFRLKAQEVPARSPRRQRKGRQQLPSPPPP